MGPLNLTHPALPAPPLAKGHTHTPWPGLRTEVMAQLASFSPWLSSALMSPCTDANAWGKQLLHWAAAVCWALLCVRENQGGGKAPQP